LARQKEAAPMAKSSNPKRKKAPKTVLKLPDLEQSKSAVLNSLVSASSQRSYDHAIREFIEWYCSEPRLAFNKTVVTHGYFPQGTPQGASFLYWVDSKPDSGAFENVLAAEPSRIDLCLGAHTHTNPDDRRASGRAGGWHYE
jgi:hypothetical protein